MASMTSKSPQATQRSIRTVLNIDQSAETTASSTESKDVTTFHRVEGDPVLRITKSKFSCIRHCCPIDNVFFSAEKEFDLWHDVLKNATKDLWDGENVSLLLHGPAANMRLFASLESAVDVSASLHIPGAHPSGVVHPSQSVSLLEQTLAPLGRASSPGPSSPSHRNDSALEKILRALLREVQHRDVPRHYKAYVAAGACLMSPDGELTNITPQGTDALAPPPAALLIPLDEGPSALGAAKGQNTKAKKKGQAAATVARALNPELQPLADKGKTRSGGAARSPGLPSGLTAFAHAGQGGDGGGSPRAPLDTERSDTVVDSSGNRVPMRMFPIPSEAAIESFAAHITAVCSASMLSADSGVSSGKRSPERQRGQGVGGAAPASADGDDSPCDGGVDGMTKTKTKLLKRKSAQRAAPAAEESSASGGSPGLQSPEDGDVTSDTFAEDDADEPRGSMLLLSVQLHQECSISKPRTSYIRILQLIHCPAVIEDALMSIARGRPLPVFASPFAKMVVDRMEGSTQIVFVQSATPPTALAALPSLAIAKATVVRTELASVADDIAAASAAFLATRQRLKDTAREIRDALKGLKHTFVGKEKDLNAASSVQLDLSAAWLPSKAKIGGDDGDRGATNTTSAPVGKRSPGVLSTKQLDERHESDVPALPQFRGVTGEAPPLETANAPTTVSPTRGRTSPLSPSTAAAAAAATAAPPCTDDDVLTAEEQVLTFKEQAQVEKLDAEMRIEAVQKELGIHSNRIITLRNHIDDAQRRLATDRYEHSMRKEKLRAELEAAFQCLAAVATVAPTSTLANDACVGGAGSACGELMSPTVVGVVRAIRGSRKAHGTSTGVLPQGSSAVGGCSPTAAASEGSLSSATLLEDLMKQLDIERRLAAKSVTAAQKREREREELLECCTDHVHALGDYCVALQNVLQAVESAAKASHSYDASLIPSFEDVKYVERTLVRR